MKQKYKLAYIDVAERFSLLSYAVKLKVGAIIVKDNRIISIGYNGMPAGWDNICEDMIKYKGTYPDYHLKSKKEVLHAESNAIAKVAKSNESCDNASLFCTHEPCVECAKLILQSGITAVYYKNVYNSSNYGSGVEFLKKSNVYIELVDEDSTYY